MFEKSSTDLTPFLEHVFFFLFVIALAIGISSIVIIFLLGFRYKNKLLRTYLNVFSALTGLFFFELVDIYYLQVQKYISPSQIIENIIIVSHHLIRGIIAVYIPVFFFKLTEKTIGRIHKMIFFLVGSLFPAGLIVYFASGFIWLDALSDIIFFTWISYCLFLLLINKNRVQIKEFNYIRKFLSRILIVFIPLIILETIGIYTFPNFFKIIPQSLFFLLMYSVWSVLNILFSVKYFFLPIGDKTFIIPDTFLEQYQITQREKEIIHLIAAGDFNKEIAWKLKISPRTVKNHIYNIFQKTGASSRIDLINSIKSQQ